MAPDYNFLYGLIERADNSRYVPVTSAAAKRAPTTMYHGADHVAKRARQASQSDEEEQPQYSSLMCDDGSEDDDDEDSASEESERESSGDSQPVAQFAAEQAGKKGDMPYDLMLARSQEC